MADKQEVRIGDIILHFFQSESSPDYEKWVIYRFTGKIFHAVGCGREEMMENSLSQLVQTPSTRHDRVWLMLDN